MSTTTNGPNGTGGRFGNLGSLGGQLGVLLCLVGFIALFLGWNGAASTNVIMAQFPFLISGGLVGVAIVVIGGAMPARSAADSWPSALRTASAIARSIVHF